ncbi:type IX secretion system sortase PorU [Flavobacterium sp. F372]|uniref:Type IX secretion system sortase PorU n=1 Tax=Flavobacterium bernardetii TaxID=2813823 RepID=A0ABR7IU27_9FLAO|nr:type IX secretion system sortase PorU [Flavobacterium bernardetii]MBC5833271.1 type IX secretion system sortase PorU [Flavobacterium bernardetii]NHF68503.1 type IX secretion system sortase PorU [Flavobacterium bernardetii]
MKKNLFILLFASFMSFAQNSKDFSLVWTNNSTFVIGEIKYNLPQFEAENFEFDESKKTIKYSNSIHVEGLVSEGGASLTNVVYETIDVSLLGVLNPSKINSKLDFKTFSSFARDKPYLSFSFNPIVKEGSSFKRVKSFTLEYTISNSNKSINTVNAIQNSVLANGNWHRFYVEKSGVYKISKGFLQSLGVNVGVDPRNIKIYGNGGRMLPLLNSIPYPIDLEENAVQFIGEDDGVFNDGDYILFYAEGVDTWNEESLTHVNQFTDKSYYYVTSSSSSGKRMQPYTEPAVAATLLMSNYDGYQFHEVDLVNAGKIGRRWFGESFNVVENQSFNFTLPNYVTGSAVDFSADFAAVSFVTTSFKVKANNIEIGNVPINAASGSALGFENILNTTFTPTSNSVNINLEYNNNGVPSSKGYLDYIILKYNAELKGYGKQFLFSNELIKTNVGVGQFTITNATNIKSVWDVTDMYNATKLDNTQTSISFKLPLGQEKKFVVVDYSDTYSPLKDADTNVANQNLKGTIFNNNQGVFQDIDYLIVTPSTLVAQAESLANFHRNNSNMNVKVVTLSSIYKEFGGGKQDVAAIRNFVKYVYDNASSTLNRVKYLNLFGDASYDFKNRITNNNNIVPIFHGFYVSQSLSSNNSSNFSLFSSFMSDDFFTLMDNNEGDMNSSIDHMDLAVGRMLVSSNVQAAEMVNKVKEYHDEKSYKRWRNNLVYYADDPNPFLSGDWFLQRDLNNLADQVTIANPFFNTNKIFTDAYSQQVSAGGPRYPLAKKAFIDAIELGALVLNYYGHGNEESFAVERIFEKADAQVLNNRYKYPLFITITCEFTRFDDPNRPTGGEYMYWNKAGGAIALLATTRQIGQSLGIQLNEEIYANLFTMENNSYLSIAESLRRSKLDVGGSNKRVVFYIGDPALKLAIPRPKVVLTKVNGQDINTTTLSLQALSLAILTGEVLDENNALIGNYNGDLAVQVYDKNLNRLTLDNDNASLPPYNQPKLNFATLGEVIYRGNASVVNGKFEFSFIVPQDIQIPVGNARVSFYAKSSNPILQDQTGYNSQIKVGGVNIAAPSDTTPPKLKLYMNDTNFVNGGITNKSPIFLAFLEDENGINTASGIGHDIVAILDGNENNPYILNDYYETETDNYKKGKVTYPYRDLAPGLHTILFKAWDVYNNLITAEIQFIVIGDGELELEHVLNYPNPFVSYTEFWFNHNRPFESLDVQVQILTITGKLVKTINQTIVNEGFNSRDVKWDGKDDFGDRIGKGVYVYRLTVKSSVTGKTSEKIEKLVIL